MYNIFRVCFTKKLNWMQIHRCETDLNNGYYENNNKTRMYHRATVFPHMF